jgi:hypothetical protein
MTTTIGDRSDRRSASESLKRRWAGWKSDLDAGHRALEEARPKLHELVDEVLEGHNPTCLPDLLTDDNSTEAPDATNS